MIGDEQYVDKQLDALQGGASRLSWILVHSPIHLAIMSLHVFTMPVMPRPPPLLPAAILLSYYHRARSSAQHQRWSLFLRL
jgi:hypothetical protein